MRFQCFRNRFPVWKKWAREEGSKKNANQFVELCYYYIITDYGITELHSVLQCAEKKALGRNIKN